jgi:hypothetical protein
MASFTTSRGGRPRRVGNNQGRLRASQPTEQTVDIDLGITKLVALAAVCFFVGFFMVRRWIRAGFRTD